MVEEEISNDDFEKQYKGEVSKSGVAILPSKRMRKIPIQTNQATEEKKEDSTQALKLTEEVKEEQVPTENKEENK